ncbi:MAG TPA: hypothetical protein VGU67_03035 [Edaphobacter sp.]|nr:hypothetical protein [Edaphobacter sp.]
MASLKGDLDQMRHSGFWPARVECGPLVYELLVNWTIFSQRFQAETERDEERRLAREDRMRTELMMGLTDLTFNEMPVRLCEDVPDGRFWPARERGGYINRLFRGSEAHDESATA